MAFLIGNAQQGGQHSHQRVFAVVAAAVGQNHLPQGGDNASAFGMRNRGFDRTGKADGVGGFFFQPFGLHPQVKGGIRSQAIALGQTVINLGDFSRCIVTISAGDQGYAPRPRMVSLSAKMASAEESVPLEAGKSTVLVTVSGLVQLK